jgi:hypothetical protein
MERKPCVVCLEKARKEALQHNLNHSTVPAALALCQECCDKYFERVAG